jgi:hypothetical protein
MVALLCYETDSTTRLLDDFNQLFEACLVLNNYDCELL